MGSYFKLILDTLPPQGLSVLLNGGVAITTSKLVVLNIYTEDLLTVGYQMKIWGDIIEAETENLAIWKAYTNTLQITLSEGSGSKTIFVKVRDDVLNESAIIPAVLELNTEVPIVSIVTGPDLTKLSYHAPNDNVNFSWQCNTDITEWKVCTVENENDTHADGIVIPTTNGSINILGSELTSNETIISKVDVHDIILASSVNGEKTIKVFVKTTAGIWSV